MCFTQNILCRRQGVRFFPPFSGFQVEPTKMLIYKPLNAIKKKKKQSISPQFHKGLL